GRRAARAVRERSRLLNRKGVVREAAETNPERREGRRHVGACRGRLHPFAGNASERLSVRDRVASPVRARLGVRTNLDPLLNTERDAGRSGTRGASRERGRADKNGEKALHASPRVYARAPRLS